MRVFLIACLVLAVAACDSGSDDGTPGRYAGASSAAGPTTTIAFDTDGLLADGTEAVDVEISIGFSSDPYAGTGTGTAEVDGDRVTLDLAANGTYQGRVCEVAYEGRGALSADRRTVTVPDGRVRTCFSGQGPEEAFTFTFDAD